MLLKEPGRRPFQSVVGEVTKGIILLHGSDSPGLGPAQIADSIATGFFKPLLATTVACEVGTAVLGIIEGPATDDDPPTSDVVEWTAPDSSPSLRRTTRDVTLKTFGYHCANH
jgi:hypothetical protein